MQRIAYFPARSYNPAPQPLNQSPVVKMDEHRTPEPDGTYRSRARLNIEPWDLHKIIVEANRLGLEGKQVKGFGYWHDLQAIILSFTR